MVSVDGDIVLNQRDSRPLAGPHRLCLGGYLSRLFLGEVTVIDLGDGQGVRLPPAQAPRPGSADPKNPLPAGGGSGAPGKVDDLVVSEIPGPAGRVPIAACWAPDGKSVFVADAQGLVRRLAGAGLKEEAKADLEMKPAALAMSAEGLAVLAPDNFTLLLLDSQTLKTKRKVEVRSATQLVSAPGLSVAVAVGNQTALFLIDLKEGQVIKEYTGKDFPDSRLTVFDAVAMSPDGKYLFASSGAAFHRIQIAGGKLTYEQGSFDIRDTGTGFGDIFCDNALVSFPSGGGNRNPGPGKDHPEQSGYFVYPVDNIRKPLLLLRDSSPFCMAFDQSHKVIYGTKLAAGNMCCFNLNGLKLKDYELGSNYGRIQRLIVQPQGEKLLLLADSKAAVIDLPQR
jgi:hypothetical protein